MPPPLLAPDMLVMLQYLPWANLLHGTKWLLVCFHSQEVYTNANLQTYSFNQDISHRREQRYCCWYLWNMYFPSTSALLIGYLNISKMPVSLGRSLCTSCNKWVDVSLLGMVKCRNLTGGARERRIQCAIFIYLDLLLNLKFSFLLDRIFLFEICMYFLVWNMLKAELISTLFWLFQVHGIWRLMCKEG